MSCFEKSRISVGVQQALFRREDRPASVNVDCSALQNDTRHEKADTEPFADEVGNVAVLQQRRILPSPGVESPLHDRDLAKLAVDDKSRAVVAEPDIGIVPDMKVHAARFDARLLEESAHAGLCLSVSHREVDVFTGDQMADDFDETTCARDRFGSGKVTRSSGQASHIASCFSHSAGIL